VRDRGIGVGKEAPLDVPGQRHLPLDALLGDRAFPQLQILDLDGSGVRERRQEAEILLGEALPAEADLEIDEADDLLLDEERRRHAGGDALDPDRLGRRELAVRGRVDDENAVLAVHDGLDEGLREPDVAGSTPSANFTCSGLSSPLSSASMRRPRSGCR